MPYVEKNLIAEPFRCFLQHYAPWPISFHTFKGERIKPTFGKKNLLDVILRHERYVCDSNSFWKSESAKDCNQSKVFIVPHTALDEPEDVHGNLFGKKVDIRNENIFFSLLRRIRVDCVWLSNNTMRISVNDLAQKNSSRYHGNE